MAVTKRMTNFADTRPHQEILDKIQSLMARKGIDGLLLHTPENVTYCTGYLSANYLLRSCGSELAVVPSVGKPTIVTSQFSQQSAEQQVGTRANVIGYRSWIFIEDYYDPAETEKDVQPDANNAFAISANVLKEYKNKPVVGIEKSTLPYDKYMYLCERFGEENLVDLTQFIVELRMIKLPWEIDVLRYAAQCAQKMMNITMEHTQIGMTEADIFRIWHQAGWEVTGGHEVNYIYQAHTPGKDFSMTQFPREHELTNGDIVRLDGGINIMGYNSDLGRTYAVGDYVTDKQQAIFDTLLAARDAGIAQMFPGNKISNVFHETMKVAKAGVLPHFVRGHVGHSICMGPGEEFPMLNPGNEMILQPGMVFCFETPYYSSMYGSYNMEDTLVITENGHELFTEVNRSLFVKKKNIHHDLGG